MSRSALRLLGLLLAGGAMLLAKTWLEPPVASGPIPSVASVAPVPATAPVHSGVGFRDRSHLEEHFHKHGAEFHAGSADEYLRLAQQLRDRPAGGEVLEAVRSDGTVTRFDRTSGAFLAFDRSGVIRTFFRPNDGERYFRRQLDREPGHS